MKSLKVLMAAPLGYSKVQSYLTKKGSLKLFWQLTILIFLIFFVNEPIVLTDWFIL
jgi:hypothetical protein